MESHDVPPPPYSETDIYSQPGHSPQPGASSNNNAADDVSIAASSSHSNIVYTPPDTPRESHHDFTGSEDHQTTASAQVFFDARAVTGQHNSQPLVHHITVSEDPAPADFPYPNWAAGRETTMQDWQTFVNYLVPDYAEKTNANIIDRKMLAESDAQSSANSRGIAEAQLDQLRTTTQRRRFEDTVREWNTGFFAPRGVTINLTISAPRPSRMPGSWEITYNNDPPPSAQMPQQERSGWRGMFGSNFGMEANGHGLKIGPITIDGDRVAIGKSFEADSRGVRWNGRDIADNFPSGPSSQGRGSDLRGGDNHAGANHRGGPDFGDHRRGRGPDFGDHGRRRGRGWSRGGDHYHDHHDRGGRGRRRGHGGGNRSRSRSSSISSASSLSSSSVSSIGSLPEVDDLKDPQLAVVKTSIQAWLNHPDLIIRKSELKRVKGEIRAAKSLPQPTNIPVGERNEVKNLLKQWADLKKRQRNIRKVARKEHKAQRKAENKAKRDRRRAEKREQRRVRRESRSAERDFETAQKFAIPGPSFASSRSPADGPAMAGPSTVSRAELHGPNAFFSSGGSGGPDAFFNSGCSGGPDAFFGPGRSGGPGFFGGRGPFGRRGFGSRGGWPGMSPEHASAHEQAAQARAQSHQQAAQARQQAAQARAQAYQQAFQARSQASQQAAQAQAQSRQHAAQAGAGAELARAQAKMQAAQAKAASGSAQFIGQQQAAQALQAAEVQLQAVQAQAGQQNAAYERSAAKYEEVEELQMELIAKMDGMQILQDKLQAEGIAAAKAGNGDSKAQSQTQLEAERLEAEIENLEQRVEGLRLEADEEFAREIEKAEREGFRC